MRKDAGLPPNKAADLLGSPVRFSSPPQVQHHLKPGTRGRSDQRRQFSARPGESGRRHRRVGSQGMITSAPAAGAVRAVSGSRVYSRPRYQNVDESPEVVGSGERRTPGARGQQHWPTQNARPQHRLKFKTGRAVRQFQENRRGWRRRSACNRRSIESAMAGSKGVRRRPDTGSSPNPARLPAVNTRSDDQALPGRRRRAPTGEPRTA